MKYRKIPVEVEADIYKLGMEDGFCFENYITPDKVEHLVWFPLHIAEPNNVLDKIYQNKRCYPYIKTLEGNRFITDGDYIITGIKGERYPCKANIFKETYEQTTDILTYLDSL